MCTILILHGEYGLTCKSIFNIFWVVGGIWKRTGSAPLCDWLFWCKAQGLGEAAEGSLEGAGWYCLAGQHRKWGSKLENIFVDSTEISFSISMEEP